MAKPPFKSLFCEQFGCPPADYEERAFQKFLYGHARWFAPVIRTINPDFFRKDFDFIRSLGEALDARQARADLLDFKDLDRKDWGWMHSGLKIRISGRKARRIAFRLLGKPDSVSDSAFRVLR